MDTLQKDISRHLQTLAVEIGCRLVGTAANRAAADYIAGEFKSAGLSVGRQEFPCPDWQAFRTALTLDGEALAACANTFSPSCDLTAAILPVGTFAELESAEIAGRIPVFYGELAQHELASQGAIYVPERDRAIRALLVERRAAALITVNPTLVHTWRLVEDYDLELPSTTVSARTGLRLLNRPGASVRLEIVTRRSSGTAANVIGRLPGEDPQKLVLCAHFDTKEDTSGAHDNAAGAAALLAAAACLAQRPHRHTLEWVAFNGEEGYGLGDMAYARETGEHFDQVRAAVNLDGVGPVLSVNTLATFAGDPTFEDRVSRVLRGYPGVLRVDPWPASDHYIFYSHGVPSIALGSLGIRDLYHTPDDTLAWVSPARVAEAARLAIELVEALDSL